MYSSNGASCYAVCSFSVHCAVLVYIVQNAVIIVQYEVTAQCNKPLNLVCSAVCLGVYCAVQCAVQCSAVQCSAA